MRRHNIACCAIDKAVAFEILQRLCEHALADASDPPSKLAKPVRFFLKGKDDKAAPTASEVLKHDPRRAGCRH